MDFKKSPQIEQWAYFRENTPKYYRWTPKRVTIGVFFTFFVPYVLYKSSYNQMNWQNRYVGEKEYDQDEFFDSFGSFGEASFKDDRVFLADIPERYSKLRGEKQ